MSLPPCSLRGRPRPRPAPDPPDDVPVGSGDRERDTALCEFEPRRVLGMTKIHPSPHSTRPRPDQSSHTGANAHERPTKAGRYCRPSWHVVMARRAHGAISAVTSGSFIGSLERFLGGSRTGLLTPHLLGESSSTLRGSTSNEISTCTTNGFFFTNKHCIKKLHHPAQPWWMPPLRHAAVGALTT